MALSHVGECFTANDNDGGAFVGGVVTLTANPAQDVEVGDTLFIVIAGDVGALPVEQSFGGQAVAITDNSSQAGTVNKYHWSTVGDQAAVRGGITTPPHVWRMDATRKILTTDTITINLDVDADSVGYSFVAVVAEQFRGFDLTTVPVVRDARFGTSATPTVLAMTPDGANQAVIAKAFAASADGGAGGKIGVDETDAVFTNLGTDMHAWPQVSTLWFAMTIGYKISAAAGTLTATFESHHPDGTWHTVQPTSSGIAWRGKAGTAFSGRRATGKNDATGGSIPSIDIAPTADLVPGETAFLQIALFDSGDFRNCPVADTSTEPGPANVWKFFRNPEGPIEGWYCHITRRVKTDDLLQVSQTGAGTLGDGYFYALDVFSGLYEYDFQGDEYDTITGDGSADTDLSVGFTPSTSDEILLLSVDDFSNYTLDATPTVSGDFTQGATQLIDIGDGFKFYGLSLAWAFSTAAVEQTADWSLANPGGAHDVDVFGFRSSSFADIAEVTSGRVPREPAINFL